MYLEPIPGPEKLAKIQLLPAVPVKATPVTMQELCDPSARAGSVLLETGGSGEQLRLAVLGFSSKPLKRSRYALDHAIDVPQGQMCIIHSVYVT